MAFTANEMGLSAGSIFANNFLVMRQDGDDDEPRMEMVGPSDAAARKKRAHHKSRNGCKACKRRKVKCDEKSPCGHCVKRGEPCIRPRTVTRKAVSNSAAGTEGGRHELRNPSPRTGSNPDAPVNMLHMELFYNFIQHTIPTLSNPQIMWESILPQAVHTEYLLNALLSVSASHLATTHPDSPRYAQAALSHLSQATSGFRHRLSAAPINAGADADALMATAMLVYYATWAAPADPTSPFLLATGARQIFLSSWRHFAGSSPSATGGSAFSRINIFRPCNVVEQLCDARGGRWRRTAKRLAALWDDPRYGPGKSNSAESTPGTADHHNADSPAPPSVGSYKAWNTTSLRALDPAMSDVFLSSLSLPPGAQDLQRGAFERVATRVAVLLELGVCMRSEGLEPSPSQASFPWHDVENYILSFPILCFSEFLPLMLAGDARALVLLLHQYMAVRMVLGPRGTWWALRRAEDMERQIGEELRARGLEVCVRRKDEVN